MRSIAVVFCLIIFSCFAQLPAELKIDSSFAYIQGYSSATLSRLKRQFDAVDSNKLVILHYGGSHIQAENPTTIARNQFHEHFGSGGRGLLFNYGAANTYSSINYSSTYTGKWTYNKSYQGKKAELPLGVCGMVVETRDSASSLVFSMKAPIEKANNQVQILFENDSLSFDVAIYINNKLITQGIEYVPQGLKFSWADSIKTITLIPIKNPKGIRFRFYGMNIEHEENHGIVYHSTGVGAAAFRSILILEKLPEQLPLIKPDIVILDFGTNDILYENRIEPTLSKEVEKAITWWKSMVPEVLIVLTSTQDLYYKKHIDIISRKYDEVPEWLWLIADQGLLGYSARKLNSKVETIENRIYLSYPELPLDNQLVGKGLFWVKDPNRIDHEENLDYEHIWFTKHALKTYEKYRISKMCELQEELDKLTPKII